MKRLGIPHYRDWLEGLRLCLLFESSVTFVGKGNWAHSMWPWALEQELRHKSWKEDVLRISKKNILNGQNSLKQSRLFYEVMSTLSLKELRRVRFVEKIYPSNINLGLTPCQAQQVLFNPEISPIFTFVNKYIIYFLVIKFKYSQMPLW